MKKWIVLALLAHVMGVSAQVTLRGRIVNVPKDAVQVALIDYWSVDHWQQVALAQLESTGTFSVKGATPVQAQCRIRMAGQMKVWSDFVMPGPGDKRDSILVFDLDQKTMNGGPARIAGSAENDLYFTLMSGAKNLAMLRDSAAATPAAQLAEAEKQFNQLCVNMMRDHAGTFTGEVAASLLYQPGTTDFPKDAALSPNAFARAHALEKIPFRTDRILYHNAFMKALNRYYNYFDANLPDDAKAYIDGIMARRNGSEPVDLMLFKYLLDKMMSNMNEAGLHHLLKWYLPDCSDDSPLADHTRTLIQALQACEPGKAVADQQWPGADGAAVSLGEVCSKNKLTLLFFWKTNCSHCKEFKPVLSALYDKYHAKGLEVYGMSLDKTEIGWRETLQREPTSWVNVYVPGERRGALNEQFPIPSTPTLIALDKDRKVLSRLVLREQLEAFLMERLK
jgi:thiol-disulfide isomerase/thioredoxin